jgi:DNA helicase-2/ATP-dependent DNA helicase PcrA
MSSFLRELPEELLHWITPRISARNHFDYSGYSTSPAPRHAPTNMKGFGGENVSSAQSSPWYIGQAVHHAKFGEGVIVNVEGSASDMRVQVKFRSTGTKWLALEYAKLTPLQ